jgi:DNA-binding CsgD family transcriptional regulator
VTTEVPSGGQPDLWLCVVHSASEAVLLRDSLGAAPRAALLDTIGAVGPEVAALHGFLGYLTPAVPWERQLTCLRHAAVGLQDAPDPYAVTFHAAWRRGALADLQQQILRVAARGVTREKMADQLKLSPPTLERRITELRQRLDLRRTQSLAAKAVELGFSPLSGTSLFPE